MIELKELDGWPGRIYKYIAIGVCARHGWYEHQRGFSGCDKCEDAASRPEDQTVEWSQVSDSNSYEVDDGSAAHEPLTPLPYQPPSQSFQNLLAQTSQQMAKVADATMAVATAQNWLAQARLFTSPADARPAVIERIAELEAECDRLRALVRPGVNVDPGDTFGGHLIWWPDELPIPLFVGAQGSRTIARVEEPTYFMPEVGSMVNNDGLLNAVEETTSDDPVKADIERTINHLQRHLVQDKEFGNLKKAVEQAGRTNGKSDAAINDIRGRALR